MNTIILPTGTSTLLRKENDMRDWDMIEKDNGFIDREDGLIGGTGP